MKVNEIKEALEKITPSPWKMMEGRIFGSSTTAIEPLIHEYDMFSERDVRNAHLIANAPEWLRYLLQENQRLCEQLPNESGISGSFDGVTETRKYTMPFSEYNDILEKIERYEEALDFYADELTYDIDHLNKYGYIIIDKDGGEKARLALKEGDTE